MKEWGASNGNGGPQPKRVDKNIKNQEPVYDRKGDEDTVERRKGL